MSSVKDRLSAIGERLAKLAQEFELDEAWSIRAELIGIAHSRDVAALREQPEARGMVDDDPISVYKAYAKGVNAGMGGLLPDSIESLLAEAVEVGTLCNLAAEDTLDAGMTAIADALSKAALTITNLGRTVAALTAAQQPVQEGGGEVCPRCKGAGEYEGFARHTSGDPQDEYAATVQCEPCEGTGEVAAHPSAPVGVEGEGEFWTWLRQAYNFTGAGNFTAYNMEVAYQAGRDSALTQQPAQAAPGWKLVPEKITTEMWKAWEISNMASESYQEDYAAMLAAAPTPPGDDAAGGSHD